MSDKQFTEGIYFNKPHANAPSFIKLKIKLDRDKLIAWLQKQDPEFYVQVKEGTSGKWYGEIDTWKPTKQADPMDGVSASPPEAPEAPEADTDQDLPF